MQAATTLFLRNGYLGTSMDDVAALANVSKQTVYTHFADKQQLFTELIRGNIEVVEQIVQTITRVLQDTSNLHDDLRELARSYVSAVIQPQVLQLRRLVIGEAGRFPELAQAYYARVPERVFATLAAGMQQLGERGLLRVGDPQLAAHHFVWLVLATPLDKAMFCGDAVFTPAELEAVADTGVQAFLAAYGSSHGERPAQSNSPNSPTA
jgi:TetR/AcrR family transcriptional repressor of mexJK operon